MHERSSKRPTDLNQLAASIVGDATSDEPHSAKPEKDPAAVALGRKGGLKGGAARAAKLTPEQRKAIAQKAAAKRWGDHAKLEKEEGPISGAPSKR